MECLSYWRLPDRLYDDPDELAAWARAALAVARWVREPKALKRPARRGRQGRRRRTRRALEVGEDERRDLGRRHRPAEIEPLDLMAAQLAQ
jgi:hypothetical protein